MPINFSSTIFKYKMSYCVSVSKVFRCLQTTRAKGSDKLTLFFKHLALAFTCLAFSEN